MALGIYYLRLLLKSDSLQIQPYTAGKLVSFHKDYIFVNIPFHLQFYLWTNKARSHSLWHHFAGMRRIE